METDNLYGLISMDEARRRAQLIAKKHEMGLVDDEVSELDALKVKFEAWEREWWRRVEQSRVVDQRGGEE